MSKKYILGFAILGAVALGIVLWALFPFPTSNPPQFHNSTQYIDPDWAFPSEGKPAIPFPDFSAVVAGVMPSVVSLTTEISVSSFFGETTEYTVGSGIITDDNGYIVTNNHVVENAQSIYVELDDGRIVSANIVGTDRLSDLAVIKIDATGLPYAYWGDSGLLSVGDWVLAIGNALGGGGGATQGIVTRLNAAVNVDGNTLYGLIQTTAAINPGNSGGPLVNMSGEVVGITSIKIVASEVEGIGFAISSDEAKPIIRDLIRYGHVTYPWLGVWAQTVNPLLATTMNLTVDNGALILEIVDDSPADIAGLMENDIIIHFGGQEVTDIADLIRAIRASGIGEEVEIVFVRGEKTEITSARLVEYPTS
ncbi:MAG: trypsin-like peptidase domain-containing protein [Chloroflexota bacterium]|nr:MAG: trypsin-like peptidase domain-containing protein [Chloroflexota bacterium]